MNYQPLNQNECTCPGMNTASMVAGIIGLLLCMIPFLGTVAPALAILFSLLGRGNQLKIKGQGLAGLIMGFLGLFGNVIFLFVIVFFILMLKADPGSFAMM